MINKIHFIKYLAVLLFSLSLSAQQVSVTPSNVEYTNNGQPKSFVSGCGVIDLKSSTSTLIEMIVNISTVRSVINNSESKLYVYSKISPNAVRIQKYIKTIPSVNWIGQGSSTTSISYNPTISFFINAADFNSTGSTLLVTFVSPSGTEYTSACTFQITKTPPPSFTLSPSSLSLACGDTAARTFTVTGTNIPAGVIPTYQWSAPGWTQVGSTATSRTFVPTSGSILPSPISVTPILNGIAQPTKTCTVTRQAFTTVGSITGSDVICTSAQYCASVAGATTFAWAVTSGANLVSLTGNGTSCATLTKLPNASGQITLSLTAGDSCGRSITRTKSINVGTNIISTGLVSGAPAVNFNETLNYTYSGAALSDPNINYYWFIYGGLNDGPNGLELPAGGAYIVSGQGTSSIALETGSNLGTIVVEVTATTSTACNLRDTAFLFVNVSNPLARSSSLTSASTITVFPNPLTNLSTLEVTVNTIQQNDLGKYNTKLFSKTIDNQVKIYDFNGDLKHSATFKSDVMSLNNLNLKQGTYVLNVTTNAGEQLRTILLVQ
ncbi:T9SS type A sorting domain-containing protein [Flavobacterium sp.]|uniref:T9SS type A sorting domain-containing protein n=1 Tax=Flavobacterium sp. TaxID=239 RepID=UPI00286DD542|nr:T9SS type A sorting domain-containing protein [Flavobacterium sp.]